MGDASSSDGLTIGCVGTSEIANGGGTMGMSFLDSPNTTSATTYQVQFKSLNSATAAINSAGNSPNSVVGSITCLEIKG